MMQRLMLRSMGTAAYPRHNGQYHLSHKGAQQAHKGNAGQDGKHTRRVLTRSLGKAPHNAVMLPPLLWHTAFKQLCKHTAHHSDELHAHHPVQPAASHQSSALKREELPRSTGTARARHST